MEDFDLIILTAIISASFIVFAIVTYKQFSEASKRDINR
jgi:hypothetical protein